MSGTPQTITVVLPGGTRDFANLGELVDFTQNYASQIRSGWAHRPRDTSNEDALASLIQMLDDLNKVIEAGLLHIKQEEARAEAALADLDRLVAEL